MQQDSDSGRPEGPSTDDFAKQAMVTVATFAVVSIFAGPVVGAVFVVAGPVAGVMAALILNSD